MAYAPTNEADDCDKDSFYLSLEQTLQRLNAADVILCLGDFNAVTGITRAGYESVVGPHGSGTPNDNTDRLLNLCAGADLRVAGSWFERHDIHRHTWYSNDGHTVLKRLITYLLTADGKQCTTVGCTAVWSLTVIIDQCRPQ